MARHVHITQGACGNGVTITTRFPEPGRRTVYLLGAGFSRALSSKMPVTDELGAEVLALLGDALGSNVVPEFQADGLTFETWLSWLAERQPYEDEAEFLADQSLFTRVQVKIAELLTRAQESAVVNLPSWLDELVDLAHHEACAVITLNYDTLLESAVNGRGYRDARSGEVLEDHDVVVGFPNGRGIGHIGLAGFSNYKTMRVHKLHGSVDWFAVPGDRSGATLERIPRRSGSDADEYRATVGGRSAFIVPPTATKGSYFDNPKTRFIWQEARRHLQQADRIVLIGYSLPITDAAIASLLSRGLSGGQARIVVVNPHPDGVVRRLENLGVSVDRIEAIDGHDCVQRFVRAEVEAAGGRLLAELRARLDQDAAAPVAVGWPRQMSSIRQVVRTDRDTRTLRAPAFGHFGNIARPGTELSEGSSALTTLTLGDVVGRDDDASLLQVTDGERTWALTGYVEGPEVRSGRAGPMGASTPAGDGAKEWIVLRPVGRERQDD